MRKAAIVLERVLYYFVAMVVAIVAAVYIAEWSHSGVPNQFGGLELYPYEGFRPTANQHQVGDRPGDLQPYHDYDYQSGELGLFSDIDIRHPPNKSDDEIRIILIGGSGAMGQGARTNEDMLYRKLETRLTELMKDTGWRVRVINLAKGGDVNYQSFIALSRWGHELEPDIILSYSGRNDLWVPLSFGNDGHFAFNELTHLITMADITIQDDEPGVMRFLARHFPNLYRGSAIPFLMKQLFWLDRYREISDARYRRRSGLPQGLRPNGSNSPDSLPGVKAIALRNSVHGLQSIKRDFLGIPMVLGWEAMNAREFPFYYPSSDYNASFDAVAAALRGYINDDWLLINVHHELESDPKPYIATHLGNEGHIVVANLLAERMIGMVKRVAERRSEHKEAAPPNH